MPRMLDALKVELEKNSGLDVVQRIELPPRVERRAPVPSAYRTGAVGRFRKRH